MLCRRNGYSVTEFAEALGVSRTSVYLAAEKPSRYGRIYPLMVKKLVGETA